MIENNLAQALREFIAEAVKDFRLPVKGSNNALRSPTIMNGYLPPKRNDDKDDFPYVLVRIDSTETDDRKTTVKASIIIGCYTKEFDGHEYCLNVYSRIRNALASMKNGTLADRYILKKPIKGDNLPEQAWPEWQFDAETTWEFHAPQPEFDE